MALLQPLPPGTAGYAAGADVETAVAITGLRVAAGGRCVLDVPELRFAAGKVVAIMGPNGAGKTTLLRSVLGLDSAVAGEIRVLGREVTRARRRELTELRRTVGYVSQSAVARTDAPLTVREVVAIGRTGRAGLLRPLRRRDWELVDGWLERLGLAGLGQRGFNELSGGEQRKTLIARAMVQEPRLLLLDEPTANLDLGWRERLVETVQGLHAETRLTVLLVCHELEVLPPACQRVVLLERGRVTGDGPVAAVFTDQRLAQLYGGGLRALHAAGRHAVVPFTGGPA